MRGAAWERLGKASALYLVPEPPCVVLIHSLLTALSPNLWLCLRRRSPDPHGFTPKAAWSLWPGWPCMALDEAAHDVDGPLPP